MADTDIDLSHIADRIVELRRIPAKDLIKNPKNWREHPQIQQTAVAAVLEDIGFADVAIGVDRPGGVVLIDGHLRKDTVPEDFLVPTIILDLDDEETDVLLAVLDPIVGMARRDSAGLVALAASITGRSDKVKDLLNDLSRDAQVEARAKGNAQDFLADFLPKGPHEDKAGRSLGDSQVFQLAFTVTAEQRDIVMTGLAKVREGEALATSIEALVLLAERALVE